MLSGRDSTSTFSHISHLAREWTSGYSRTFEQEEDEHIPTDNSGYRNQDRNNNSTLCMRNGDGHCTIRGKGDVEEEAC